MRSRPLLPLLVAASLLLALAGCSFHAEAGPTVSAASVAKTAAKALAAKVGSTPAINCGSEDIIVVKGKKITCELTDTDGLIYDVAITFTSVKGSTYHIDVKVADTAKNAPSPTVDPGSAPTVKGTDIAKLAAQALAPSLKFTPDISCVDAERADRGRQHRGLQVHRPQRIRSRRHGHDHEVRRVELRDRREGHRLS